MDWQNIWQDLTSHATGSLDGLGELGLMALEAIIVIIVARFIAHQLRDRTRRSPALSRLGPNGTALLANGVAIGVYIITGSVLLGILGANWTAVIAAFSVGTVAITLALQDILRNFVAGVYLLLEQPFSIGQKIQVKGVSGIVEAIGFRTTRLRNANQEQVLVPNATVFVEIITNRSAYHLEQTRIKLKGIALAIPEIEPAIRSELAQLGWTDPSLVRVDLTAVGSDGAELALTLRQGEGAESTASIITQLAKRFPAAMISVDEGA